MYLNFYFPPIYYQFIYHLIYLSVTVFQYKHDYHILCYYCTTSDIQPACSLAMAPGNPEHRSLRHSTNLLLMRQPWSKAPSHVPRSA